MRTPEQVVPLLMHGEGYVRRYAVSYLGGASDPGPMTAEELWKAMDRWGRQPELWEYLDAFGQTEESYRRTVEALREAGGREAKRDGQWVDRLIWTLNWVDYPLLRAHGEELLGPELLPDDSREHLRKRLELGEEGPEELWGRMTGVRFGKDGEATADAERLVDALALYPREAGELALRGLRKREVTGIGEEYVIDVLAKARYEPAVPLLLEKVDAGERAWYQAAARALVKIGTVEVVEKLAELYGRAGARVRPTLAMAFEGIKRPESEAALLRLLEEEQLKQPRNWVAEGLCILCPERESLERVHQLLAADKLKGSVRLKERMLGAGQIVGYELPEQAGWLAEVEDAHAWGVSAAAAVREYLVAKQARIESGEATGQSIRRQEPKVGRNDPCPCGSGKKYKKCCGG